MKFIVSILLTALLAFAFGLYFPWWTVAVAGFIVAAILRQPPFLSFIAGFIGLFLLWLMIILKINTSNDGVLAPKITMLMGFGSSSFLLMLMSSLIGGLTGGLGALTGSLMRRAGE